MTVELSAGKIAEMALRKIGSFSINDTAADGEEFDEALRWLDVNMAELAGKTRIFRLVPDTISVPLTGGTGVYDLNATIGSANLPTDGIQFPVEAQLKTDTGAEFPIEIITRGEYEEVPDKTSTGTPNQIFIDRLNEPTLSTVPVLGSGITGYTIELTVQTYAPDFAETKGNQTTGLQLAWQKWAIYSTAASIGDGSVRRLPLREIEDLREMADDSETVLLAFENREHHNNGQRLAFRDF